MGDTSPDQRVKREASLERSARDASAEAASPADLSDPTTFVPFEPKDSIECLAGNLPHWRQEGTTYFVTFRLADALPSDRWNAWKCERETWLRAHPEPHTPAERHEYNRLFPARVLQWLDEGFGACLLREERTRLIVETTIRNRADVDYHLGEFVVMPNHVHVLVTPLRGRALSKILQSWKSVSSHRINKLLGRSGALWQKESFDHIVRSAAQLEKFEQYIRDNPKPRAQRGVDSKEEESDSEA